MICHELVHTSAVGVGRTIDVGRTAVTTKRVDVGAGVAVRCGVGVAGMIWPVGVVTGLIVAVACSGTGVIVAGAVAGGLVA